MTDMTMVERVARALADADARYFVDKAPSFEQEIRETVEEHYHDLGYTEMARAAIAAMMEPTPLMVDIGGMRMLSAVNDAVKTMSYDAEDLGRRTGILYRAMIKAALDAQP